MRPSSPSATSWRAVLDGVEEIGVDGGVVAAARDQRHVRRREPRLAERVAALGQKGVQVGVAFQQAHAAAA